MRPLRPVGTWRRAWHRYRRQNRFLVTAFVAILLLALGGFFVLQRAQEASPDELTNRLLLFVLWYLDLSLIVILLFILLRSLVRLGFERRSGILGSRFRTKLVLTYVGLTFVPVLFIFLIATNLLQRSIDFWFSAPVEKIVTGGREIAVALRERMEERLEVQAERAAELVGADPAQERLPGLRRTLGVDVVAVYRGRSLVAAVADPQRIQTGIPPPPFDVPSGVRADRWRGGLLVRAWQPTANDGLTVLVGDVLPADVLQPVLDALAREDEYQQLKAQRGTLTATAVLVFLAVTLLLLFATVWIGLYLSRRFTQPLLAVAAATQRVAEGDEPEEVAIPASDEVAVLVHSFNAMVRRVRATEKEILASNQELATLLATIPTGVLSLDLAAERFRPNPAAATMLGETSWMGRWIAMQELDRSGLGTLGARLRPPRLREGRSEVELEVGGVTRYLEVTTSPLSDGGWVAAMDDLSLLVRAQRQAAWSEVAQRIAHEIKNPLTPIRLAAERVQRRAADVGPELQEVIDSSCAAIVAQVDGLRELLDAFRQYARMPLVEPRPEPVDRIVREVASLYDGLRDDLEVEVEIADDTLVGLVDPAPLRQALVNLVDNAVDAIPGAGRIVLAARRVADEIEIVVEDTGTGLPTQDPETLLQPFFSTKGRGSGMGLALVHRVVADHDGSLRLENVAPHGARVTIRLPAAPDGSATPDGPLGDAAR